MPTARKKPRIQASGVEVGNRTLEGVLIDLAEQVKANDARCARAEERAAIALQTIAAVSQDLRAITQEIRAFAERTDSRLDALEKSPGA
jgi:uncharacterized protein YaaN involved in tellurite resistance